MADLEKEKKNVPAASEEQPAEKKKAPKMSSASRKKFKYGSIATAITCIVVAIVVVINVLVNMLVEKYPIKLDLTESAMFEISEDTIGYLETLEKDVNFTVLMAENSFQTNGAYMKMVYEVLERYAQYSDKINLTYVDPTTNPDVVNSFQSGYSGTLTEGDVIISDAADATKMRVVNVNNMFTYDQEKYYMYMYGYTSFENCITAFTGEQDLTAALMYVTDADPVNVAVIATANGQPVYNVDYNAASVSVFKSTLTKNGYNVVDIDLYTDALDPAQYDMLVLPAPVNDLTQDAVDQISAFLYNDGTYHRDLIYFADFTQSSTPNLNALLESWGLSVSSSLVMEGDETAAQQVQLAVGTATVPVAVIAEETYSAGLANATLPIVSPLCRSIDILWESKTSGITTELLKSSDTVYLSEMSEDAEDQENVGAQTIMAMSTRKNVVDSVAFDSNIMVIGSMMLSDYYVMQTPSYNNAEYLMSAINTMTGKGSGLIIAEKALESTAITITAAQLKGINIVLYGIPFAVVIIGIVVFIRRKNR